VGTRDAQKSINQSSLKSAEKILGTVPGSHSIGP